METYRIVEGEDESTSGMTKRCSSQARRTPFSLLMGADDSAQLDSACGVKGEELESSNSRYLHSFQLFGPPRRL